MGKDFDKHFAKEGIGVANKHMREWSASMAKREHTLKPQWGNNMYLLERLKFNRLMYLLLVACETACTYFILFLTPNVAKNTYMNECVDEKMKQQQADRQRSPEAKVAGEPFCFSSGISWSVLCKAWNPQVGFNPLCGEEESTREKLGNPAPREGFSWTSGSVLSFLHLLTPRSLKISLSGESITDSGSNWASKSLGLWRTAFLPD